MICRCFGHRFDVAAGLRAARSAAELMVGLPDYETYAAHMQATHPDQPPMTRDAFFRARQAARFGGGGPLRCC